MVGKGIVSEILRQKKGLPIDQEGQETEYRRTSICLPVKLHRRLKVLAAEEGRSLNEIMLELIEEGLKGRK